MNMKKNSIKYEIVVASDKNSGPMIDGRKLSIYDDLCRAFMHYADCYYNDTDMYVSTIATEGRALYKKEWGCPSYGESVVTFNCTANTVKFIDDLDKYEKGVLFIASNLKKEFNQSTVTITKINESDVIYLS